LIMMLWDLAGGAELDQVRTSYLRGAAGAVLVCDLTRAETLDHLPAYAENLRKVSPDVCLMLTANKYDLADQQQFTPAQIETVAAGLQAPYYLSSARTGEEVETMFRHLGRLLVASD
jgi:GTPase SAR1 family protein